jgi:Transposase IS116/IS110/IS902 family
LALITHYDQLLTDLELSIVQAAKHHDANTLHLLQTVPGIGKILSLVLLYEIHDINRFPRVQDFVSYCRLVNPTTPLSLALCLSALTMRERRLVIAPLEPGHESEALLNRLRLQG